MNENDAENNTRNEPNNEEEAPPTPPQGKELKSRARSFLFMSFKKVGELRVKKYVCPLNFYFFKNLGKWP